MGVRIARPRIGPFVITRNRHGSPGLIGSILILPLMIPAAVILVITLVVWALTAALWLIVWTAKIIWWVLAFPFRLLLVWPVRAWRNHRAHKRVKDAFARPPLGPRIAA